MFKSTVTVFAITLFLSGCGNEPNNIKQNRYSTAVDEQGNKTSLPIMTLYENLSTPESVTLSGDNIFISNIGGAPKESIGLGFINNQNGPFITGLDDPKGIAMLNNGTLMLVSDHPNIKLISVKDKKILQTLAVPQAGFLNDAVTLSNNMALVSDTGNGNVYKISLSDTNEISQTIFITANQLMGNGVNGLAFDVAKSILYLATSSFGGDPKQGHLWQVLLDNNLDLLGNLERWSSTIIGNGRLDGIALKNDQLILSDWETESTPSSIFVYDIPSRMQKYRISGEFVSPADIALDAASGIIYIPEFTKNIVSALNVSSIIN